MAEKFTRKVGSFVAKTAEGKAYTITVWQEYIRTPTTLDGKSEVLGGLKKLETEDGEYVNRIEKGKYRLVSVPEADLFSDDPNAP